MRISWKGPALALLLPPIVVCAVMALVLKADEAPFVSVFLMLIIPACVICYGATLLLFLPRAVPAFIVAPGERLDGLLPGFAARRRGARTFHELRKVMGTSKPMILVPLCYLTFLD